MKTLSELKKELMQSGLPRYFHAMKAYARNAVTIDYEECDESEIPVGASKLGGCPDLPAHTGWFHNPKTGAPLCFLCQIDLADAAACDADGVLPPAGMLYFFYDVSEEGNYTGYEPDDAVGSRVFFYDGDPAALKRTPAPINLEKYGVLYAPAVLTFDSETELPSAESVYGQGTELPEDEQERLGRRNDDRLDMQINKLLGYPDAIQGPMESVCAYAACGLSCRRAEDREKGEELGVGDRAGSWKLLLQIDSNEELGMMWGDCGRLYFFIREEDLENENFENVRLIMQCY